MECLFWSNVGDSTVAIWCFMLRNIVWSSTKFSILSEGVNEALPLVWGKLDRGNTEKGVLGVSMECLFWLNVGNSTTAIWWFMLRNIVWSSTKSSIPCERLNDSPVIGCGMIYRPNTEKGVLGLDIKCLFWSNVGDSTTAIWWFMLRNIVWSLGKWSIPGERLNDSPLNGCGMIYQSNTEKGVLGLDINCLFWSNGGYSTITAIWWFMLRNIVWSSMKSSILSKGVDEALSLVCGKLDRDNIEKALLGASMECLYWSNGGHSTTAIWWFMPAQQYCLKPHMILES
jgi:hypothetical protein